jgi:hypothetical protein
MLRGAKHLGVPDHPVRCAELLRFAQNDTLDATFLGDNGDDMPRQESIGEERS